MMRATLRAVAVLAIVLGTGCGPKEKTKERPITQAWVGPVTLKLRAEVNPGSKPVAEVRHGDELDVVQVRRRFVRVRTRTGVVGWTEVRNLLGEEKMAELKSLSKEAAKLPSQGQATVYGTLNVHTEPNRPSTSFYQISEGMKVDVVGHRLVAKSNKEPKPPFSIPQAAPPRPKKKKEVKIPPVPRPPEPGLPANWIELSKSYLPAEPAAPPPPPIPMEDWTLVRTKDGHAGWVLTRNLVMSIPDEVAQYSEGARITSYFVLADVQDGDQTRHHWLWTTIRDGGQPYQFDSFRVFIYMLRRHRYETALIERRVEGYYPVVVERGATPRFTLILRGNDGKLYRKTWVLEGYNARKIAEAPYEMPKENSPPDTSDDEDEDEPGDAPEKPSFTDRIRNFFRKAS